MKKLNKVLFGFGSITAVVAPVAAVVACDDDKPEAAKLTATDVVNFTKDKGYKVTEAQAKEILEKIGVESTFGEALAGKITAEATHGSDDFAVIVKGKKQRQIQDNLADLVKGGAAEYTQLSLAGLVNGSSSLEARWGLTEEKVKDATAILYLQNDSTTFTVEYVEVVKTKDGHFVTADLHTSKDWTVAKATK